MKKAQVRAVLVADGMSTSFSEAPCMFRLDMHMCQFMKVSSALLLHNALACCSQRTFPWAQLQVRPDGRCCLTIPASLHRMSIILTRLMEGSKGLT